MDSLAPNLDILRDDDPREGLSDPMTAMDPPQYPQFFYPEEWLPFASLDATFDPYDKDPGDNDLGYTDSFFVETYEVLNDGKMIRWADGEVRAHLEAVSNVTTNPELVMNDDGRR